jgi:hypothetical protein
MKTHLFVSILAVARFPPVSTLHEGSRDSFSFSFPFRFSSFPVSHLYPGNEKRSTFLRARLTRSLWPAY